MPTPHELALLGTAQAGSSAASTTAAVDALFAGAPAGESELLLQAGAFALYRRAGALPATYQPGPAAPAETRPPCSDAVARMLASFIFSAGVELQREALAAIAGRGLRLPHTLLPVALERVHPRARDGLAAVAGERGRWLGQIDPAWALGGVGPATDDDGELTRRFEEGRTDERADALRRLRARDANAARDLLDVGFARDSAEVRRRLLACLEVGLSLADEPLLEKALDDRGGTVRAEAARLLGALPGSALLGRCAARALGWVRFDGQTLHIDLPKAFDPSWARDGVSEKPPPKIGKRAWWLAQTAAAVAPAIWHARLGATPQALVAAAAAHEHALAILEAFTRAAVRERASEWLGPLWDAWGDHSAPWDPPPRALLMQHMPVADAHARAVGLLAPGENLDDLLHVPAPWPVEVGRRFLALCHESPTRVAHLGLLERAALALPPASLAAATAPPTCPADADWAAQHAYHQVANLFAALDLRRRYYQELDRDHPL